MSANGATQAPPSESRYSEEDRRAREETKIMVIESIGDMLEDAWTKPEAHRKKTVKQLLLKWHPDKNTEDDEELATAATQHIHAEVERLEQGLPRYSAPPPGAAFDPRNPFSTSPTFQRYFEDAYKQHYENMSRRRKEQQEQRERDRAWRSKYSSRPNFSYSKTYGTSSTSSNHNSTNGSSGTHSNSSSSSNSYSTPKSDYKPNGTSSKSSSSSEYVPPPSSSYTTDKDTTTTVDKVSLLLRQARGDLRAADNDYDVTEPAYEWVCFKAHQAAEKALKAVNLSKNNTKSFSHDLASLAAISRDEELKRTATKLQQFIGDNNKLYNLVFVDTDVIPHEEFSRELACDVMMCARDILERVQEIEGVHT